MLWRELGGTVAQAKDRFHPPSLLLIQPGSNDLTEIKSVDCVNNITSDILRFKLLFPNAKVVWSEILMRRYWHNAKYDKAVELARKPVNLAVKNCSTERRLLCDPPSKYKSQRKVIDLMARIYRTQAMKFISTTYKGHWNIFYLLAVFVHCGRLSSNYSYYVMPAFTD